MSKRVLVTGSRNWGINSQQQRDTLEEALKAEYSEGATLVSGACPTGADALAEQLWSSWGGAVERHPADWSKGRAAGPIRNKQMVDSGVDVCLAFILNESRGASGCARLAERAGIRTKRMVIG